MTPARRAVAPACKRKSDTRCYSVACPAAAEIWPSYTIVRAANRWSAVALCRKALAENGCAVTSADFMVVRAPQFDAVTAVTPGKLYEYAHAVGLRSAQATIRGQLGLC